MVRDVRQTLCCISSTVERVPKNRRPTCSQMATSSLSALDGPVGSAVSVETRIVPDTNVATGAESTHHAAPATLGWVLHTSNNSACGTLAFDRETPRHQHGVCCIGARCRARHMCSDAAVAELVLTFRGTACSRHMAPLGGPRRFSSTTHGTEGSGRLSFQSAGSCKRLRQ